MVTKILVAAVALGAAACGLALKGTASETTEPPEAGAPPAPPPTAEPPPPPPPPPVDAGDDAAPIDAGVDAGPPNITFVQAVSTAYAAAGSTNTASLNVTAGNTLVVATYWVGTSPVTVTDSLGNTFVAATASGRTNCSSSGTAQLWYAIGAKGGADVVTLNAAGNADPGITVVEYTGVASLDVQSARIAPSASATASTADLTTTGALDVIVAIFQDTNGTGTADPGAGFTARTRDTGFYTIVEDDLPGVAPGTHPVTAGLGGGRNDACWAGAAIALRAK